MITEYHRPESLAEALLLLERPDTIPLGGGTFINTPRFTRSQTDDLAVVDLQALGLHPITVKGNLLQVGATATLHKLAEYTDLWPALVKSIHLEATYNLRQMATVAGTLVACNGRSAFATAMLALDAELTVVSKGAPDATVNLGYFLPLRPRVFITQVSLPIKARLAFEYVARTPADLPIVCVTVAQWPSGRTRLAVGGWGEAPLLAMDGPEPGGAEAAAQAAYQQAADAWAGADYRSEMAAVLARRALQAL
jgi:CO/xanthine dehydrogenase FAD-binding subunit